MDEYKETLNKLKEFFKEFKFEYDSSKHFMSMKKYSDDKKIITTCVPTPFIGNIEDPQIIVLALNPSFDVIQDEMDKRILEYDKIDDYYEFLKSVDVIKVNDAAKRIPFTTAWWKSVFDGVNVNKNIGIFNLMCYHSKHYPTTSKKMLDSQKVVINYLKALLSANKEIPIIFVWGKKYWMNFIERELKDCNKVFELNEGNNKMNKSIKKAIENKVSNYNELKKLV